MKSKQELSTEQPIPIFTQHPPEFKLWADPLIGFEQFLHNKPIGYWLIRESRKEGQITLMQKIGNNVAYALKNTRYAFIDGQWVQNNNGKLSPTEDIYVSTAQSKLELLLKTLYENHALEESNLIVPSTVNHTRQPEYYRENPQYTIAGPIARSKQQIIYANLLQSLDQVNNVMSSLSEELQAGNEMSNPAMHVLDAARITLTRTELTQILRTTVNPFKANVAAQEIKDLFEQWLDANKLTTDLLCPISLSLFAEPYYTVETGMVYDADSLFSNGKCLNICPLTRKAIEAHPVHLEGYRGALYSCLEQFFDLIMLYQTQMTPSQQKETGFKLSSAPSVCFWAAKTPDNHKDDQPDPPIDGQTPL